MRDANVPSCGSTCRLSRTWERRPQCGGASLRRRRSETWAAGVCSGGGDGGVLAGSLLGRRSPMRQRGSAPQIQKAQGACLIQGSYCGLLSPETSVLLCSTVQAIKLFTVATDPSESFAVGMELISIWNLLLRLLAAAPLPCSFSPPRSPVPASVPLPCACSPGRLAWPCRPWARRCLLAAARSLAPSRPAVAVCN
ncbi:hypothetical protein E2562_021951 [Oryza meyeriana var. granulata]|uniref:Uncharacterized protein n=1 Tax=Oryza meyeriana var. granulata TaxID=110450 RepID=A0A6G1DLL7_9ORYZ|nr:hypothetical protein E2562_021951 [Oryza meyeriana var. granulata]